MPKIGLDFFGLDVNFLSHIKIRRIVRACGLKSVPVLIQLLSNIYKYKGYYIEWSEDECFAIADDVGIAERAVQEIVAKSLQVGLFNSEMFNNYGILTSERIQDQYFTAVSKRKSVDYDARFALISLKNVKNAINVDINRIDSVINPQSKVKESKVEDSTKYIVEKDKRQTENEQTSDICTEVIEYLNLKAQTRYRASTPKTKQLIRARLAEGFILDDFKIVIDNKVSDWKGTEWEKFLRPETLFGTKFEGYLNARQTVQKSTNKNADLYARALAKAREIDESQS
ncbi:conserved phage C-terminal domain-containing protein [Negativicoccus succinicivorans]|uniref:conserved phage C-terminal domain-containing protein n=1 Tax=Negativicoccus succinicivorans TaxID=620903 RepID=UPI00290192DA|nr:conserved phage C-terminal domain-containing protein [Negativicoccus succinicivorans]MDU2929057.1 conserved phage C-terminal domain-containing protein [Negativicoccus succinicivorans]